MTHPPHERAATARYPSIGFIAGQSGEARIFLIQDDNLTAEVPLRRSILQSTLRQKYRSTGRHNPQRDGGPEKGLYRLHPIALGKVRSGGSKRKREGALDKPRSTAPRPFGRAIRNRPAGTPCWRPGWSSRATACAAAR